MLGLVPGLEETSKQNSSLYQVEWKKKTKPQYFCKQNNKITTRMGAFVVILGSFCLPGRFSTPESFQLLYSWSNCFLFLVAVWILPLALESITTVSLWVIFIWSIHLHCVVAGVLFFPDREYFCHIFGRMDISPNLWLSQSCLSTITLMLELLNWNVCVVLQWNWIETQRFSLLFKVDWG